MSWPLSPGPSGLQKMSSGQSCACTPSYPGPPESGLVRPDSGGPGYEGVQAQDWPDDIFWRPDGPGLNGHDIFRSEFGFPHHPGLLERALREFSATGLRIPWLSCFGNHEAFHQGVGAVTDGLADA